jgi:hypothetical protein
VDETYCCHVWSSVIRNKQDHAFAALFLFARCM